jgi:hypothetical protein
MLLDKICVHKLPTIWWLLRINCSAYVSRMKLFSFFFILCGRHFFSWLLQDNFPHNTHHRVVAIYVRNYTLKHGYTWLIIVGGRIELLPHVWYVTPCFMVCYSFLTSYPYANWKLKVVITGLVWILRYLNLLNMDGHGN